MQTINRIPFNLQQMQSFQSHSNHLKKTSQNQQLNQYKLNMKKFIIQVQQQISQIIQKHQKEKQSLIKQINLLKLENQELKKQVKRSNHYHFNYQQITHKQAPSFDIQCFSPIKTNVKNRSISPAMIATKSNFFAQTAASQFLPQSAQKSSKRNITSSLSYQTNPNIIPNKTISQNLTFENQLQSHNYNTTSRLSNRNLKDFPYEIIDPQNSQNNTFKQAFNSHNKSRFEIQSKQKKMRRQEVLQYLEAGSRNLDQNTNKILKLLGKAPPTQHDQQEQAFQLQQVPIKKSRDQQLNSSLSAICQSLDNSFIAKRSRSKKKLKDAETQKSQQKRKQKQIKQQKVKKQRGIKNLLKGLRNSMQMSPKNSKQIVKDHKLLKANDNNIGKSKVMINLIPVHTQQQSRNRNMSGEKSEGLKKRNSILSKSITGISAYSDNQ